MEYYTQEAIEKANKIDPKKKKIKKIIKFVLIVFIVYVIISNTPLFGLAVVGFRWCRPMIYKEHLQMGAIWDLRQRSYTCFKAYPLGGDPEEDDFTVETPNKLIITPFDIKDGYHNIYFRGKIAEKTKELIKNDFPDTKVYVYCGSAVDKIRRFNLFTDTDVFIRYGQVEITVYAPMNGITEDEAMDLLAKYSDCFETIRGKELTSFEIVLFENDDDYQKIKDVEGEIDYTEQRCLRVRMSYNGNSGYVYFPPDHEKNIKSEERKNN